MIAFEEIVRRSQTAATGNRKSVACDALEQIDDPLREVAKIRQQIRAEICERNFGRCKHEHHAEQQQVHEIDHDERKKGALIAEVGLIFRNHPAGKREMERPGRANHGIKQSPIRLHIHKEAKHAIRGDRQDAVERKKIRRQGDPEIIFVRHHVAAITANTKPANASAH